MGHIPKEIKSLKHFARVTERLQDLLSSLPRNEMKLLRKDLPKGYQKFADINDKQEREESASEE